MSNVSRLLIGSFGARSVALSLALLLPLAPSRALAQDGSAREAWRTDLDRLLTHLGTAYANFAWSVQEGGFAPAPQARAALDALARASNDGDARRVAVDLLKAFADNHVRSGEIPRHAVAPGVSAPGTSAPRVLRTTPAGEACRTLGYRLRDGDFDASLRALPAFGPRPRGPLRTALARTSDGTTVALVRLHYTAEDGWLPVCEQAWEAVRLTIDDACDDACAERVRHAVGDSLLAWLAHELRALRAEGAEVLVVDLTGNGGGSEWAEAFAHVVGRRGMPDPVLGMVRHPHWIRALTRDSTQLAALAASTARRTSFEEAVRAHQRAVAAELAALRRTCDWTPVWDGAAPPPCHPLVMRARPSVPLDSVRRWGAEASVLRPIVAYRFEEGAWDGPLVVVTNRRTASAAEQIAAMLADHAGAVLAGERSMGIGCGFTNGGITLELPALGLRVRAPDCARLRADGRNERSGVVPHAAATWQPGDDTAIRRDAIEQAVRAARGAARP